MEFFNFINSKISDGVQLNITIRKVGENLTMSIIPDTKAVKDKAVKDIEPLVLTGTANDFEKGFESAFAPVVNVIGLVSDVSEYEKNIEEARKKTEMETKKKKDAEVRNQGDTLLYQVERSLKDLGDKVQPAETENIEAKLI